MTANCYGPIARIPLRSHPITAVRLRDVSAESESNVNPSFADQVVVALPRTESPTKRSSSLLRGPRLVIPHWTPNEAVVGAGGPARQSVLQIAEVGAGVVLEMHPGGRTVEVLPDVLRRERYCPAGQHSLRWILDGKRDKADLIYEMALPRASVCVLASEYSIFLKMQRVLGRIAANRGEAASGSSRSNFGGRPCRFIGGNGTGKRCRPCISRPLSHSILM